MSETFFRTETARADRKNTLLFFFVEGGINFFLSTIRGFTQHDAKNYLNEIKAKFFHFFFCYKKVFVFLSFEIISRFFCFVLLYFFEVLYSTINYKDGMAVLGRRGIVKKYPIVPGMGNAFEKKFSGTSAMENINRRFFFFERENVTSVL